MKNKPTLKSMIESQLQSFNIDSLDELYNMLNSHEVHTGNIKETGELILELKVLINFIEKNKQDVYSQLSQLKSEHFAITSYQEHNSRTV